MTPFLQNIVSGWVEGLPWLAVFMAVFSLLAKIAPCNKDQPILRKSLLTDFIYFLVAPLFTRTATQIFLYTGWSLIIFVHPIAQETLNEYFIHGYGPLSELPVWLQAALIIILSDVMLYWIHRLFHTSSLWDFHAIHHSSEHIDWMSSYRFHPLNICLSSVLTDSAMLLVGFSPAGIIAMSTANLIYSVMVHANVNWTFGPLKYVFASPVFHRWHHTTQKEGLDKNFAPTFPLLDIMFGTFYMPDHLPSKYGVLGAKIPESYTGQFLYPLRKNPSKDID